jgi:hypothetical protein
MQLQLEKRVIDLFQATSLVLETKCGTKSNSLGTLTGNSLTKVFSASIFGTFN